MKAFIALLFVAVVAAESDPYLLYNNLWGGLGYNYGVPYSTLGYSHAYGVPAVAGYTGFDAVGRPAIKAAPCTNVNGEPVACRAKREAESDPALLLGGLPYSGLHYNAYNLGYNYGLPYATTYGYPYISPCKNYLGMSVPC